jgi:hypothetical protein
MLTDARHSTLSGIAERLNAADAIQERFNSMPMPKRKRIFYDHHRFTDRLMSKYRLGCICTCCACIFESFRPQEAGCSECGNPNSLVSEYYC